MNLFNWMLVKSGFTHSYSGLEVVELVFAVGEVDIHQLIEQKIAIPDSFDNMLMKRRSEYLAGRICAIKALEQLDIKTEDIKGLRQLCDRTPDWPNGIVGSITHTDTIAAACVGKSYLYNNIGIDIEKIMDIETCESIIDVILTLNEFENINYLNKTRISYEGLVTLIFSAKETLFKALYPNIGYVFGFEMAKVVSINHDTISFCLDLKLKIDKVESNIIDVKYFFSNSHVYTYLFL